MSKLEIFLYAAIIAATLFIITKNIIKAIKIHKWKKEGKTLKEIQELLKSKKQRKRDEEEE